MTGLPGPTGAAGETDLDEYDGTAQPIAPCYLCGVPVVLDAPPALDLDVLCESCDDDVLRHRSPWRDENGARA